MARRTAEHLRSHLSVFEEERYPIQKGYIAQLLFLDGCSVPDVVRKVKTIVEINDPGKNINEESICTGLYKFKKLVNDKRHMLTKHWPSLITLFMEPLYIPVKRLPVVPVSSQPVDTSVPSSTRNPDPSTSLALEMLEPGTPVTSTLIQPAQNSTTNNSPSSLMTCKLPSPRKLKGHCENCVNKQRTITNMLQKNKHLHKKCREFKLLLRAEKGNFSLKRYNQKIKRKTQSVTKWKTRYASLSEACRNTHNLLKLVQNLEGKLTAAQEENINMASANERLESLLAKMKNGDACLKQVNEQLKNKLEKAEDDNAHLKRVYKQLKSKRVKTEDQDTYMEQVHEELQSVHERTEADDANLKLSNTVMMPPEYSHASHSPELEIKEEFPLEVPCISHEDVIQTTAAEDRRDQNNLFSENEATSSYTQLSYANSPSYHAENGKHQSAIQNKR